MRRFSKSTIGWNQWLAGLIDGDGCLLIFKHGYTSCEITMGIKDEHAFNQIQQKLGGSLKLRSGSNSIGYRLYNQKGIIQKNDLQNPPLQGAEDLNKKKLKGNSNALREYKKTGTATPSP